MAANFINLTDTLEEWRVKANEVYGKVGDLDTLVKDSTVVYTGVVGQNADDFTGTHATFTVTRFNGSYSVAITNGGSGYEISDTILVDGAALGGSSGTNDATITITAVDPGFAATGATIAGVAVGDLISEVNGLRTELGSLLNFSLNTDTSTFYEAVNELENIIRTEASGDANYALTTDAHNLVAAINEIEAALRGANVDYDLDTDSDDVVSAINEFQTEIGRIEDFDAQGTSANALVDYVNLGSTIVSAINALKDKADINADILGGVVADDYDGPDTDVVSALNSLYNRSDLGTLDDVYVRRSGTLDMEGLFQIHSAGITSNGNNMLLKTGAADVTAVTINASNQNVGIGGSAGTNKLKVTGSINATTGIYWDGDSIDTRYLRTDTGSAQTLEVDTTVTSSINLNPASGETVTIGGSVVTNDSYNFLEWTQDQVGGMFTSNSETGGISGVYDDATGKITLAIANNSHTHLSGNITDFVEAVQDVTGGMVSGNTENGISVSYDDSTGKLNFDVNDPTITISGEASGSATMTNLGNTNIAVTLDHEAIQDAVGEMLTGNTETGIDITYDDVDNKIDFALSASPKIILAGDATGNITLTNLATGDYTLTVAVVDDSHNHVVGNIDNFTEEVQDIVGAMVNPTNIESGINVTYDDTSGKINFDVNDPTITLSGDVSGTATMSNLGSITITTTVSNDSHNHDGRYYTESESDSRFVNASGDSMSGRLTVPAGSSGGVAWPNDSFGGTGDTASITLEAASGEATRMRFKMANDPDDYFEFIADSDSGLKMNGHTVIHSGSIGSQSVSFATNSTNTTNASKVYGTQRDTNATYYLGFVAGSGSGQKDVSFDDQIWVNPGTNTIGCTNFSGTATSAKYADLAENYLADAEYSVGTVMCVGGEAEVTQSNESNHHSVLGVVSDKPAYLMNSELEGGTTVALKGRVPVRVIGMVKKGDRLAPSPIHHGLAEVNNDRNAWSFAIALEDKNYTLAAKVEAVIL